MKRLLAASLLSFYLIPLVTLGRPAGSAGSPPAAVRVSGRMIAHPLTGRRFLAAPGAVVRILVPVTGTAVGADGTVYTISGAVTLNVTTPLPPPPPPPVTVNL